MVWNLYHDFGRIVPQTRLHFSVEPMPRKLNDADSSHFPYKGESQSTSTGLIQRLKENESAAWERFVSLYAPLVRYWLRDFTKMSRVDRQDILQEILGKVNKSIKDFDEKMENRSFRGWLRTITRHTALDYLEKNERRKTVNRLSRDTGHFKAPKPVEVDLEEEENEKVVLLQAILETVKKEISERDWEIVNLFVNAGKTSAEVGEIMSMPGETVRRIKNRILQRLRAEYAALGLGEDELPSDK